MKSKTEYLQLFHVLADLGVSAVTISFSGGGDSGDVDNPVYFNRKLKQLDKEQLGEFDTQLTDFADILLQNTHDWYNNDGGHGEITLNVDEQTYEISQYIRIVNEEHYSFDGEIKDQLNND